MRVHRQVNFSTEFRIRVILFVKTYSSSFTETQHSSWTPVTCSSLFSCCAKSTLLKSAPGTMIIYMPIFFFSLLLNGVFGDEVKSVMEGDSVTLNTDVIKQRDDLIVWCYGPDDAVVAIINGKVGSTTLSDDEKYKDRLELNDQTGSLTINNLTTNHSGVYKLKISSNKTVSYKRFNVTVSAHLPVIVSSRDFSQNSSSSGRSDPPAMRISILSSVFFLLVCVIFFIIISVCIRKRGESIMKTTHANEPLMEEGNI